MWAKVKTLFSNAEKKTPAKRQQKQLKDEPIVDPDTGEEIPRYPPFIAGLKAAEPQQLINNQVEIINRISHILALDEGEFDRLIMPVIYRLAAFVHLLPASETHHHCGGGGLFRHSLEVACFAAQMTEGQVFTNGLTPQQKRLAEPRYRVAAFVAGLIHDIGKASVSVTVVDKTGGHQWYPSERSLYDWTQHLGLDRYWMTFKPKRQMHEEIGIILHHKVITDELFTWITSGGVNNLWEYMLNAAQGKGEHRLKLIVMEADGKSVQKDAATRKISASSNGLGVPAERHVVDAARRLIGDGSWTLNVSGSRIWNTRDGIYVVWKKAAEEIRSILDADGISGIEKHEDSLADMLIDRGYAVRNDELDTRYFKISPGVMSGGTPKMWFNCLKLTSPDVLYSYDLPTTASIYMSLGEAGYELIKGSDYTDMMSANPNSMDRDIPKPEIKKPEIKKPESPKKRKSSEPAMPNKEGPVKKAEQPKVALVSEDVDPELAAALEDAQEISAQPVPDFSDFSDDDSFGEDLPSFGDDESDFEMPEINNEFSDDSTGPQIADPIDWLEQFEDGVKAALKTVATGLKMNSELVFSHEGGVYIDYPDGVRKIMPSSVFLNTMASVGLIVGTEENQKKNLHILTDIGRKGLRLADEHAAPFKAFVNLEVDKKPQEEAAEHADPAPVQVFKGEKAQVTSEELLEVIKKIIQIKRDAGDENFKKPKVEIQWFQFIRHLGQEKAEFVKENLQLFKGTGFKLSGKTVVGSLEE